MGAKWFFFEEEGLIVIDLDKRLHCLSRNPTLKLVAISFSSSSSQIIGSTSWFTLASTSSLEDEANGEDEGDEEDDKDEVVRDRVLYFWTGQAIGFFFRQEDGLQS